MLWPSPRQRTTLIAQSYSFSTMKPSLATVKWLLTVYSTPLMTIFQALLPQEAMLQLTYPREILLHPVGQVKQWWDRGRWEGGPGQGRGRNRGGEALGRGDFSSNGTYWILSFSKPSHLFPLLWLAPAAIRPSRDVKAREKNQKNSRGKNIFFYKLYFFPKKLKK